MITLITILFAIAGVRKIRQIKLLKQVIYLYETCEEILRISKDDTTDKDFTLSYKASSEELNELNLAFNQVAKIINIGNQSTKEGDETLAILQYNEAYQIFKDFKNQR